MSKNHLTPEEREKIIARIIQILENLGIIPAKSNSMEVDHYE